MANFSKADLERMTRDGAVKIVSVANSGAPSDARRTMKSVDRTRLQGAFVTHWRQAGGPDLVAEYSFHPSRRWRFDFAAPALRVGIEIDGGQWMRGAKGHGYGHAMERDFEKQNHAAALGWTVFRLSTSMITGPKWHEHVGLIVEFINKCEEVNRS